MSRTHPFIEVSVNGKSVNNLFYERLVSATITDAPGQKADTCELVFDDSGNEIEVPDKGAKITVRFGFRGASSYKMGVFTFEKASIEGGDGGELVKLSCKSADMRSDVKEPLSEHFDEMTVGNIVSDLAARHGYDSKISNELSSIKLKYIARTEQSTVDFLTRLADRVDALFAVKDNQFLFLTRGSLPPITIRKSQCDSWNFTIEPRPKYGKVQAGWYDRANNRTIYEEHSTGLTGPANRLRKSFSSQQEAKKAAEAEVGRLNRATGSGSLTLAGMPEVMADAPIVAAEFRKECNGNWRVASVEHSYNDTYMTTVNLEAPKEGKK
ncbi:late control protein [Ochrobactrum sp. MR28]|nr:late control protein [Ochrobactrum sp. MR28]MBX8816991.1 late control protein [Ochrobactrum sp. MR31]